MFDFLKGKSVGVLQDSSKHIAILNLQTPELANNVQDYESC